MIDIGIVLVNLSLISHILISVCKYLKIQYLLFKYKLMILLVCVFNNLKIMENYFQFYVTNRSSVCLISIP
jgi:hypothetical protein